MNQTPEFRAAFKIADDEYEQAVKENGEKHPKSLLALITLLAFVPGELQGQLLQRADELGLLPQADCYLENGCMLVDFDALAARSGMSEEECDAAVRHIAGLRASIGLPIEALFLCTDEPIHQRQ
jgi:hypothetical protein